MGGGRQDHMEMGRGGKGIWTRLELGSNGNGNDGRVL